MMEEPEESRLDQTLRDKFDDFDLTPSAQVWAGIEQHLVAPAPLRRRQRRPLPLLVGLVALLAGLMGWLLPHQTAVPRPATAANPAAVATGTPAITLAASEATRSGTSLVKSSSPLTKSALAKTQPVAATTNSGSPVVKSSPRLTHAKPSATHSSLHPTSGGRTMTALALATSNPGPARAEVRLGLPISSPAATTTSASDISVSAVPTGPLLSGDGFGAASADSVPATLQPLVTLERQTLVQLPSIATLTPGPPTANRRTALVANLRAERTELFRLQRRTDSLLLALGDLPGAPLASPPATAATPAPDTARPRPLARRWSLLLAATPEQNTLTLQGPESDTLTALRRNHENGRAGFNAALLAEYQLTPRLSVGGGVGYNTFGTNLNITNKSTEVRVAYDTTTTTTTNVYTSTNQTHSIRIIQVPQLSPIFNGNGQVIRYDTVYVPRQDTVFTTIVQHDTVHTARKIITPLISKHETLTTTRLQPTYRFFTVPVLLRYRLSLGPGRWWADVAAGGQFQFFLGGTQVVTSDGENFHTETITPGNGPFRALNLALSGSLALNYALTNRLSLSVAPSLRWQALSVYKTETGLIQQPTATGLQLGMRIKL